jgi:EAL and modified HD-GYP domain-containing signal transduction protein
MYIARQPIFNRSMNVYAYELLFRSDISKTEYTGIDALSSTAIVVGGMFELGLDSLVGDKRVFVNFNRDFIMSDAIEIIDPEKMVIEILEETVIDQELIERFEYLRAKGYDLALDDYAGDEMVVHFSESINMIKFDIRKVNLDDILPEVKQKLAQNKVLIAEKIETIDEFNKAKKMGFHFFQGYFFSKPNIVGGIKAKKSANIVYQQILEELYEEEPSFDRLSEIVITDPNMAYRLLRVASIKKEGKTEILSIKRGLISIGLKELERWVYILMLQELSNHKPLELMRLSLARSKFGETLAVNSKYSKRKHEITLMCLFSVIDAMIDEPMEKAIGDISLSQDVKNALINQEGELMNIGRIVLSYESADWYDATELIDQLDIDYSDVSRWYLEACSWADKTIAYM